MAGIAGAATHYSDYSEASCHHRLLHYYGCCRPACNHAGWPPTNRNTLEGRGAQPRAYVALVVVGLLFGKSPLAIVPSWISLPSVLLLDVLPCTLIYVILVRRALSASGLLRQGTRQAGQRG